MRARAPRRLALAAAWGLVLLLGLPTASADEIDDAARLPPAEALVRLAALYDAAREAGDTARTARLDALLGPLYLRAGRPYAALTHLEARWRATGAAGDRVAYGEALVATARGNIAERAMGRQVTPFLRDAVEVLRAPLPAGAAAPLRARAAAARMEAHHLLGEPAQAVQVFEALDLEGVEAPMRRFLHDLLGRVRYAQGAHEAAGRAFEQAGNDLGAAAAWDAARRPEQSIPIYARVIAAAPEAQAALDQALGGARYTGAHVALLEALAPIDVPAGEEGLPLLLARAELLEAAGRAADALPLLRDAAGRAPTDTRALLRLARLTVLAGDAEDEATWDAAADAYVEAIRRRPESEAAAQGLSWIAARDYRRLWSAWRDERVAGRCLRVQQALVEAVPDDAMGWANLGNTLRVLGRTEEALAAYKRAIEANPYDPAILSDSGLAHAALGTPAGAAAALAAYEESLRLDAGHLAGRQNAARALWLAGEDDRAEAHLGAAVRTARAVGRSAMTYRHLLDRIWRTRHDPRLR